MVLTTISKNIIELLDEYQEIVYLLKFLSSFPPLPSNINQIRTPNNYSQTSIGNIIVYCAVNGYFSLQKFSTSHHHNNFERYILLCFQVEAPRWSNVKDLSWLLLYPDSQWTVKIQNHYQWRHYLVQITFSNNP